MQVNVQDTASSAAQDKGSALENDKPKTDPPKFNAPATRTYLQSLNQQHDNLTEDLQKTMRFLSNSLNGYLQNPKDAGSGGGGSSGSFVKLSSQVISRDTRLQERVAQNLSTPSNPVHARDAASSLEQSMDRLGPALRDGTPAGQNLSRFVCQSLVTLTNRQSMGAGLERDLAQHDIYVPQTEPSARTIAATSQALSSTLTYIKANNGQTLNSLPAENTAPPPDRSQTQGADATSYRPQDAQRQGADTTYLDIFRQHRSQATGQEAEERPPEQVSDRVRNLIERAADTARRANLFPGQDRSTASPQPRTGTAGTAAPAGTQVHLEATATGQQPSLSELSARAARLQQQFREERQRLASETTTTRMAAAGSGSQAPAAGNPTGTIAGDPGSYARQAQSAATASPAPASPGASPYHGELNLNSIQTSYSAMQSSLYGRLPQHQSLAVNYAPVQDTLNAQGGEAAARPAPAQQFAGADAGARMAQAPAASAQGTPPNLQNMFISASNTMHHAEGNTVSSFAQNSMMYTNLQANRTAGSGIPAGTNAQAPAASATLNAQGGEAAARPAPAQQFAGADAAARMAQAPAGSGTPAANMQPGMPHASMTARGTEAGTAFAAAAAQPHHSQAGGAQAQAVQGATHMPQHPGQMPSAAQRIEPTLDTFTNAGVAAVQGAQTAPGVMAAGQAPGDPAVQPQAGADLTQPAGPSFFRRVFSMFSGAERPQAAAQAQTQAAAAPAAAQPLPQNPPAAQVPAPGSPAEAAAAAVPMSAHPLDDLMSRLKTQAQGAAMPPEMKAQALKLIRALENPVADLTTVNQWLSFVTGPMNPSSPQAVALHQWAFMLLIIRFRQLGKSAQEFLAKSGKLDLGEQEIEQLMPRNMTNREQRASKSLLDDTMAQIQRLQRIHDHTPDQVLPRYVPLPPNYDGGREGGFTIREEKDGNQRTWHLSFFFDIKTLGPIEIKAAATPPELQLAFTAETGEGLRKVQELLPQLRSKLQEFGITTRSSTARLGVVRHPNAGSTPPPERGRDDGSSLSIDI